MSIRERLCDAELRAREHFRHRMASLHESLGRQFRVNLLTALSDADFDASASAFMAIAGAKSRSSERAVLQVALVDAGMQTRMWANSYEPRVNASLFLLERPDSNRWLLSETYRYGADSSGDTPWSLPADPRHIFVSLQAMHDDPERVVEAHESALRALSQRIVERVSAVL